MATMAVSSDNSTPDCATSFQVKPSPSKKIKMESTDNSDDDEDYDPVSDRDSHSINSDELDIKIKTEPETRTRKRPPVIYRIGDVLNGIISPKRSGNKRGRAELDTDEEKE